MNQQLSSFAARLRELIEQHKFLCGAQPLHEKFDSLALELFSLQFKYNSAYRKICEARKLTPHLIEHWTQIPAVPAAAFKEQELTSLALDERTVVFHSSGTTGQKPSRHFHNIDSLAIYETSLWKWFQPHFGVAGELLFLTPSPIAAPHSSLVYMFEVIRRKFCLPESSFTGKVSVDGSWTVDFDETVKRLKIASDSEKPLTVLGTAFSFVHFLDFLLENNLSFRLPEGSRVMETGGYKNHSRVMPKSELHEFIRQRLGLENILCEYGMSELSSQAYNSAVSTDSEKPGIMRHFQLPPWACVQVISPESGCEVGYGQTGIIRIFDLANVFSVAAIQTGDLGVRRDEHFDLIGRAQLAEPRGCSLMSE